MHQSSLRKFTKRIQIWDGRQKVMVKIQKTLCGVIKTENLIKSTCFYPKTSRVHVFCSNFSRVRIFCDEDHLKVVPESNRPGIFPSRTIVDNLHRQLKSEALLLKQKVLYI